MYIHFQSERIKEKNKIAHLKLGLLTSAASVLVLAACGGTSSSSSTYSPIADCSSLLGKTFEGSVVKSSTLIPKNSALGSDEMCQVSATQPPFLDIEVILPKTWTGRLWHQGGGGFDGTIPSAITRGANGDIAEVSLAILQQGAVYAASNGGNRSSVSSEAGPAVWLSGSDDGKKSAEDYNYAAVGKTMRFAKAVTVAYYGHKPRYSYFNGCSNGGRNAYTAAQYWPTEYDGIVSGCEGMDLAGQVASWMSLAKISGTAEMPSQSQWQHIYQSALSACDASDGLKDGVISNYTGCKFDIATEICGGASASTDPTICLTPAQAGTATRQIGNLVNSSGKVIYSKYQFASWITPTLGGALGPVYMALATGDNSWALSAEKIASFDLERDYKPMADGLSLVKADHDKAAVASFIASGKRMIHWHDSADGLVSLEDHQRNIETMHTMAKSKGLADPETNSRYFIVPGTGHGQGASLKAVNWSKAIIDWVEKGIAPEQLEFTKIASGVTKTMPVCRYPTYPMYKGGDINASSSYQCATP